MVDELHETHPGICRMKVLGRSYVWWLKMDEGLIGAEGATVQSMPGKQKVTARSSIHRWERSHNHWVRLHLDYAKCFVKDSQLKCIKVFPMNTSTSTATDIGSNSARLKITLNRTGSVTSELHHITQQLTKLLREQFKHSRRNEEDKWRSRILH